MYFCFRVGFSNRFYNGERKNNVTDGAKTNEKDFQMVDDLMFFENTKITLDLYFEITPD